MIHFPDSITYNVLMPTPEVSFQKIDHLCIEIVQRALASGEYSTASLKLIGSLAQGSFYVYSITNRARTISVEFHRPKTGAMGTLSNESPFLVSTIMTARSVWYFYGPLGNVIFERSENGQTSYNQHKTYSEILATPHDPLSPRAQQIYDLLKREFGVTD